VVLDLKLSRDFEVTGVAFTRWCCKAPPGPDAGPKRPGRPGAEVVDWKHSNLGLAYRETT